MTLLSKKVVNPSSSSRCLFSGFDGEIEELETNYRGDVQVRIVQIHLLWLRQFLLNVYFFCRRHHQNRFPGPP